MIFSWGPWKDIRYNSVDTCGFRSRRHLGIVLQKVTRLYGLKCEIEKNEETRTL